MVRDSPVKAWCWNASEFGECLGSVLVLFISIFWLLNLLKLPFKKHVKHVDIVLLIKKKRNGFIFGFCVRFIVLIANVLTWKHYLTLKELYFPLRFILFEEIVCKGEQNAMEKLTKSSNVASATKQQLTITMEKKCGNHTSSSQYSNGKQKHDDTNHSHSRNNTATEQHDCRVEMEKKKIEFESSRAGGQESVMKSSLGFVKNKVEASSECQTLIWSNHWRASVCIKDEERILTN